MLVISSLVILAGVATAAPMPFLDGLIDFVQDNVVEPAKDLINAGDVVNAAATTPVPQTQIDPLVSIAQFARASFCSAPVVLEWACGEACDANPETQVLLAGGDDGAIPGFFVAFDPPTNSIVVAHQGTNRNDIQSIINDIDIFFDDPLDEFFPGASAAGVQIHGGFQDTFERTALIILDTVRTGIETTGATNVIVTGHSLGAAVSLLDSVHLRKMLDPAITMTTLLFGMPRVGNEEFAAFVDETEAGSFFQFVLNDADPVTKVPPIELGFHHPSGEIFQKNNTAVGGGIDTVFCPGQENENCSTGISLFDSTADLHRGPYLGSVFLGSRFCTL